MSSNTRHMPKVHRLLKKYGYTYDGVERKLREHITSDFCGFADLMAFRPFDATSYLLSRITGVLAIQVCSYSTLSEHIKKVTLGTPAPALATWLRAENRFEIWAFPSPRDGRKPPKFRKAHLDTIAGHHRILFSSENTTELTHFGHTLA